MIVQLYLQNDDFVARVRLRPVVIPMVMRSLQASLKQQRMCCAVLLMSTGQSLRHFFTTWYTAGPSPRLKASIMHALCCSSSHASYTLHVAGSSPATADGPRDAPCQSTSCQTIHGKNGNGKKNNWKRATENWTTGKIGSEKRKGMKNWQQKLVTEIRTAIFQLPFLPFTCQTATQL